MPAFFGWGSSRGSVGVAGVRMLSLSLSSRACLCALLFFLFVIGILHSMLKATQLVQGIPNWAASQRTWD